MSVAANFLYDIGDEVKDNITGYTGIVTARIEHFTGCLSYHVTSQTLKDGSKIEPLIMNENQLTLLTKEKVKRGGDLATERKQPVGGDDSITVSDPSENKIS